MSEKRIIDYKLVESGEQVKGGPFLRHEDAVKYWIKQGWQPLGGLTTHSGGGALQTMVKYEP